MYRSLILAGVLALIPAAVSGQGIALEGGGSWLGQRDEEALSWGVGLYLPTGERTIAGIHYVQWQEGEGTGRLERCAEQGCHGGGMHLLYRVLGSTSYGWFLGGGLDVYERVVPGAAGDEHTSEYLGAWSLATLLARGLADNLSIYAHGVVSSRAFDVDMRNAYLHLGLVVRPF
jgi:hypothetical protein